MYYVYILTNRWNTVTYTGVTNDLVRRVYEHRERLVPGFSARYHVTKLVTYETFTHPSAAIAREKQLKAGSRMQKVALIEQRNPDWCDVYNFIVS